MKNMEINVNVPMVVFDNQCLLCMKFVQFVDFFARGKIAIVGHYSEIGIKIRNEILDESALDMFWFIDKNRAYGGRAALVPLLKSIFSKKGKKSSSMKINEDCKDGCKTVKAVFVRSSSILRNSKKIDL